MQHEFDWSILLIYETNTIRLWRKQRVGATVAHLHYSGSVCCHTKSMGYTHQEFHSGVQ